MSKRNHSRIACEACVLSIVLILIGTNRTGVNATTPSALAPDPAPMTPKSAGVPVKLVDVIRDDPDNGMFLIFSDGMVQFSSYTSPRCPGGSLFSDPANCVIVQPTGGNCIGAERINISIGNTYGLFLFFDNGRIDLVEFTNDGLCSARVCGVIDGSIPRCLQDLDANGTVNVTDLLQLLAAWGTCP